MTLLPAQNSAYLGAYSVPSGYFGERDIVHVVLCDQKLVHVMPYGYCNSPFLPMDMQDQAEAAWLIANHPNGKKYYRSVKT